MFKLKVIQNVFIMIFKLVFALQKFSGVHIQDAV